MDKKKRILTGIRPTGALHLGHYVGALETWLEFQDSYESFFLIADYQALGDNFDDIDKIYNNFVTNKEIHNYRFQGLSGQQIFVELSIDPSIRYGTKIYINNPEQMYDLFEDSSTNKLINEKAIIGEKILLKNNGTFTLSIDYDFERHSNYYDFDYFFMFWDREKKEWVNDFPEYNFIITSTY